MKEKARNGYGKVEEEVGGLCEMEWGVHWGQATPSFRQLPPEPWLLWQQVERKQSLPRHILLGWESEAGWDEDGKSFGVWRRK